MQPTFIKATVLTKVHRKNGPKIKQSYELRTGDLFRRDNHSFKYSKKDWCGTYQEKTNRQAFDQSCFSTQGLARIICFKQNSNADLMCDSYKCSTVRKQFSLDSTIW